MGARCSRLRAKLDEVDMPSDDKLAALELFENYLESKWEELRFLSFAENESLIAIVADLVVRWKVIH